MEGKEFHLTEGNQDRQNPFFADKETIMWTKQNEYCNTGSPIKLSLAKGMLKGKFVAGCFRATHGFDFTYEVSVKLQADGKILYSVWSSADGKHGDTETYEAIRVGATEATIRKGFATSPSSRGSHNGQPSVSTTPTISVPPEVFQAFLKTCARPRFDSTKIRGLQFQGLDVIGYEQADSGVGSQWGFIIDVGLSDFKAKFPNLAKRVNMPIPRAERTNISKLYRAVTESGWVSPGKASISCITVPMHPH